MEGVDKIPPSPNNLCVSFGYQCDTHQNSSHGAEHVFELSSDTEMEESDIKMRSRSFSCLSGAALSANATLANTNICNGVLGEEILPGLDSPKSFRRLASSPSLSKLELLSSSSQSSMSTLGGSLPTESDIFEGTRIWTPMSAPSRTESSSFLNTMDVQMAGGAAGEDRVQAVCSGSNGWLFCGIYDGFNGRDAADFLAATLYETIGFYLHLLECQSKLQGHSSVLSHQNSKYEVLPNHGSVISGLSLALDEQNSNSLEGELLSEAMHHGVLNCLVQALSQAEIDFMNMVEREMEDRPDLVSVGSCVLAAVLHGSNLYVLNLGDSRAVLATANVQEGGSLQAIQLTETHTVDNEIEYKKVLADHPDDPLAVIGGRVKGKLKVTRAFGVGYLKKRELNDALMGILRVHNLCSPPYIYTHPFTMNHLVSENDLFVILGSDGLFDFFKNGDVVEIVHQYIKANPFGDPAKYLIEQLICKAAENAGFSTEELMRVPAGRRRKYHDDVTVIVIILGNKHRTSKASTSI
ncbi:pyruvate dehydrogenase phosphatase protein [Dioscorea alata]|uniref:Pyruvate dehydrogenase phosphatase protein n=1 Tax=Dioscorea alata TaxID=55571 RepID=A0ACB7V8R8_DIOAL|nr:pyruvate dehydrogenase phosphatase protein [Dioscorea alata]